MLMPKRFAVSAGLRWLSTAGSILRVVPRGRVKRFFQLTEQ